MWFRRKLKADPAETIRDLRHHALSVNAAELGIDGATAQHVWGLLMETGYPAGVATLVTFLDGTTSLYFSKGGGIIGVGEHAPVRAASATFLAVADAHLADFTSVSGTPLPAVGRVRFYVRVGERLLTADTDEQDLGYNRHALSPVFHAGHAVITAVREEGGERSA